MDEELANERVWHAYVDRAAERFLDQQLGPRQERAGADAFAAAALAAHAERRAGEALERSLDKQHFVGRIDDVAGEAIFVGRYLVRDDGDRPLSHRRVVDGIAVVNWQARAAKPFYTARPGADVGVARRRRFTFADGTVASFSDESFLPVVQDSAPAISPSRAQSGTSGAPIADTSGGHPDSWDQGGHGQMDALLAALSRGRERHMRDIVATIQAEQYELMERPGRGILAVQGAPGTGKTAVALHRLSMLLVRDPQLSRTGTLLLGPSSQFLEYVARVLPDLGDTSVDQRTIENLTSIPTALEDEPWPIAHLKGDARMAQVLQRAVDLHVHLPDRPLVVQLADHRLELGRGELADILDGVRADVRRHDQRRSLFLGRVVSRLSDDYIAAIGGSGRLKFSPVPNPMSALEALPAIRQLVENAVLQISAESVLADLWTRSEFLVRAADAILDPSEVRLLWSWVDREWDRDRSAASKPGWARGDVPLLDELAALIAHDSRAEVWGHIAVDEAQDLTPMELRLIGRRVATGGGITLLGDLAQASGPWTPTNWRDVAYHLAVDGAVTLAELRIGFRLPTRVLKLANSILPYTGADVPVGVAVRDEPDALADIAVATDGGAIEQSVAVALQRAGSGLTVLIGTASTLAMIPRSGREACHAAGVEVLEPQEAKGLEFDHVITLEPESIVASAPSRTAGARLLYVAVTRATRSLTIVRSSAMPFEEAGTAALHAAAATPEQGQNDSVAPEKRSRITTWLSRGRSS
ncbi:HelD family protein [Cellulomonas dongxiuzhuiae]|uniref:ATP-binding domain-containing protein n=2 Tax=Cellulomonas dongxiuzhuiae TaxID=2819979 RepID=A0ABX8GIF8_9CELL|nr:ATP-binding domain-containing protein [Cellulomonas dongxiuzhuiae]MBO3094408.1 ATP-binding domain-containing protein [Cellulomonas dongxiuzhuiae]QWC15436.1 ATP-binding domain-containing protein [Cellulomonas dongxiuzhuiae]